MHVNVLGRHLLNQCLRNLHSNKVIESFLLDRVQKVAKDFRVDPALFLNLIAAQLLPKVLLHVWLIRACSEAAICDLSERTAFGLSMPRILQKPNRRRLNDVSFPRLQGFDTVHASLLPKRDRIKRSFA